MLNKINQNRLINLLLQIANSINRDRNVHLRKCNVTSRQGDVLRYVSAHPNCTITDIAIAMGCVHQTTQQIVKRMLEKDFLTMKKSTQDGRYQILNIAQDGQKLNQTLQRISNTTCQKLLKGMSNEKQKAFLELLIQGLNNLKV